MKLHCLPLMILAASVAFGQSNDIRRLNAAAEVLNEVMQSKDRAIPQDLLEKAECAVVVPGLKKGAFIVGGKYGRGFVSCRKPDKIGWSSPAAVRVEGGSIGFQIGGSETDVVMLVMNERGMKRLLSSRFTLGGDASIAAGPVGRDSTAQTDAFLTAEILSWSRSRGVFAGVSLQGATLRQDVDVNKALYGQALENRTILTTDVKAPEAASQFLATLNKYSSRK
jgi:Uncharacterized conserved protein